MDFFEKYKVNNNHSGKFYKVYDEKGRFIYEIDAKDEKKLTYQFLKGVTCFVLNNKGEVLLEQRANTELTPGKIDLVSGHVDNNEVEKQSIIRELWEEVGIPEQEAQRVQNLGRQRLRFESNGKNRFFFIEFFYLKINNISLKKQKEEVASLKWVPMEKAFDMIRKGTTKFPRQNNIVNYEEIFDKIKEMYFNKEMNEAQKVERELD